MDRNGIGTASWVEILWTVVCTVGVVPCFLLFKEGLNDWDFCKENGINGERRLLAVESFFGDMLYVIILGMFALVGAWAMLIPSPNPSGKPTALAISATLVFCITAGLMVGHSFLRRYWRDEYVRRRKSRRLLPKGE